MSVTSRLHASATVVPDSRADNEIFESKPADVLAERLANLMEEEQFEEAKRVLENSTIKSKDMSASLASVALDLLLRFEDGDLMAKYMVMAPSVLDLGTTLDIALDYADKMEDVGIKAAWSVLGCWLYGAYSKLPNSLSSDTSTQMKALLDNGLSRRDAKRFLETYIEIIQRVDLWRTAGLYQLLAEIDGDDSIERMSDIVYFRYASAENRASKEKFLSTAKRAAADNPSFQQFHLQALSELERWTDVIDEAEKILSAPQGEADSSALVWSTIASLKLGRDDVDVKFVKILNKRSLRWLEHLARAKLALLRNDVQTVESIIFGILLEDDGLKNGEDYRLKQAATLLRWTISNLSKRPDLAIRILEPLVKAYPQHVEFTRRLACAYEEDGKLEMAIKYFDRVESLDLLSGEDRLRYASCLQALKKYHEAIELMSRPKTLGGDAQLKLAVLLLYTGDYEEAIETYHGTEMID